jgi:ABC-2 type transporter
VAVLQHVSVALRAGGMYFDVSSDPQKGTFDRGSATFFILVCIAFTPPFTVITVWQQERTLVRREVDQNVYSLGTYFCAKTAVLLPVETTFAILVRARCCCLEDPASSAAAVCRGPASNANAPPRGWLAPLSLARSFIRSTHARAAASPLGTSGLPRVQVSLITYFMFGFQHDFGKFCVYTLCILLSLFIAESMGLMFAMVCKTADLAIVLASIIFILLLSLTGFLTSDTPVYYEWIQHISFLRCASASPARLACAGGCCCSSPPQLTSADPPALTMPLVQCGPCVLHLLQLHHNEAWCEPREQC